MNTPYLFACLHVLVSCVYASCSPYIHRRPALMPTQSSKQKTVTMTYMCGKKFLTCNLKFPTKESVSIFFGVCVSRIKFIPIQHKSVIVHVCFVLFIVCLYKYNHSGRLAELECNGALSARLQEHFGGNWVMPRYSRRPNHPISISVREFENSRKPQAKKTVTLWCNTKVFSLWKTQRATKQPNIATVDIK